MPEMGESVTEGTVLEWHVSEGDSIEEGQTMVEVSTDKVDAEVPAPASGTVTKILVQVDEEVDVGKPLAEIDPNGGAPAAEEDPGDEETEPAADSSNGAGTATEEPATQDAEKATSDDASVSAGRSLEGGGLEIVMPEMGESVTEGTVLEWHVSEGDSIEEG
ncbi:MAG TPA: biotin/lipoyl-containing protein, partial [Solirubrobacterales bacterium]|nr:biotin/lipoyl-containing protein [Solirubrobacterales bacterium]